MGELHETLKKQTPTFIQTIPENRNSETIHWITFWSYIPLTPKSDRGKVCKLLNTVTRVSTVAKYLKQHNSKLHSAMIMVI